MAKEKVFIVLSHKHSLKPRSNNEWEVTETVEFVNQLRDRHTRTSSAIGDYINRTMITGTAVGMADYNNFETYIRNKYKEQLAQLDAVYRPNQPETPPASVDNNKIVDNFGNVREKTVFDA